jgi:hypothetical protein
MLTVARLRWTLAAAFAAPEAEIAVMLNALSAQNLLPHADEAPLDTVHVAGVVLASLSGLPAAAAASEVMRLSCFASAGTVDRHERPNFVASRSHAWSERRETVGQLLEQAIDRIRAEGVQRTPTAHPLALRLRRAPEGEVIVFEVAAGDGAVEGIYCVPPEGVPSPHCSYGALAISLEVGFPWLMVTHLSEQLGPLPDCEADNDNLACARARETVSGVRHDA